MTTPPPPIPVLPSAREVAHDVREARCLQPCDGDDHYISCEQMTAAIEADRSTIRAELEKEMLEVRVLLNRAKDSAGCPLWQRDDIDAWFTRHDTTKASDAG